MSNTYALTTAGVLFSLMTPNGNFVAFGNTNALYIWDSLAAATVYTNPVAQLRGIGLSGNGNRLVYWSGTNPVTLTAVDLAAGSNWVIATAYQAGPDIQFDHNSRFMTYLARPTLTNATQLYLYDFDSQTSTMVSRNFNTSGPVNGDCDSAAVGVDGRFIA